MNAFLAGFAFTFGFSCWRDKEHKWAVLFWLLGMMNVIAALGK